MAASPTAPAGRRTGARCDSVRSACRGSCVTITMVVPSRCCRSCRMRHDLVAHLRVEVARGLVGEQQAGPADDGARDRDALLLPARELRREVVHARAEPDALERRRAPPAAARRPTCGGTAAAARRCRSRAESGTRWNVWKTNPISRLRSAASSRSRYDVTGAPSMLTRPRVGASSRPMRFSSVLLPQPEGPMIDTNSPGGDVERDVRQRHGLDPVGAVDLLHLVEVEHRGGRPRNRVPGQDGGSGTHLRRSSFAAR